MNSSGSTRIAVLRRPNALLALLLAGALMGGVASARPADGPQGRPEGAGVAAAMIATTTGAAVMHTTPTTLRMLMQNHAASVALDLLSAQEAAQEAVPTPRTPTDPANLMSLVTLTTHTYRRTTWKKPWPRR